MTDRCRRDPWNDPNWAPLKREATLIQQLTGAGVTSLGRASYAKGLGNYYNAFFSLSIGLERLAKLVCVCDHAIENGGSFPTPKQLKATYGHDLEKLIDKVEEIEKRHALKLNHGRPQGEIQNAIVACLNSFADAKQGRYNNFDALDSGQDRAQFEPLRKWWDEVAEPILRKHFYGEKTEQRALKHASHLESMWGANSSVLYFDERGDLMNSLRQASIHTGKTEVVQKWSRYYSLTTIRWLSCLFSQLCRKACYDSGLDAFSGHWEFFSTYCVDDSFLKTRKVWPLT